MYGRRFELFNLQLEDIDIFDGWKVGENNVSLPSERVAFNYDQAMMPERSVKRNTLMLDCLNLGVMKG